MHDDQIERRLRRALREEAAQIPFTITAAELERRVSLRGRATSSRRLTLLLAAAVAVGAIGVSALAGALSNQRPSPTTPVVAVQPTTQPSPRSTAGPVLLPSLDELIGDDDSDVLVAQAHGPSDGPGEPVPGILRSETGDVILGDISGDGEYRVTAACFGSASLEISVHSAAGPTTEGTPVACNGSIRELTVSSAELANVVMTYTDPTSWRVVVRSTHRAIPLPTANPIISGAPEGLDELVRVDDRTIGPDGQQWADGRLVVQEIEPLPARLRYRAQLWCQPGHTLRLLFGDEVDDDAVISPFTETHILCDGLVHDMAFEVPEVNGGRVYVASQSDARWSVLIESATPPVRYAKVAGWQMNGAFGPELAFETHETSVSLGGVEGGGPLMVVVACAGPEQDIDVAVDVSEPLGDEFQHFTARCTTEGQETGKEFVTESDGYLANYTAPEGSWSMMTVLVPNPAATPN
jgi:hypothetical protein